MANSKYEYVRNFETFEKILLNTWIVIRIDGIGFHRFSKINEFKKPFDKRALNLMNEVALEVMEKVYDILCAYGQSDEYSFVLIPTTSLYNRRKDKLISYLSSLFTALYHKLWGKHFKDPMKSYAIFDARAITYPTLLDLRNYLSWRQVDCHINNLYSTTYNVLINKNYSPLEAEKILSKTNSSGKNEILFSNGINYNNIEDIYRKGSIVLRRKYICSTIKEKYDKQIVILNRDLIKDEFWNHFLDIQSLM